MTKLISAKLLRSLRLLISFIALCCLIACGGSKDTSSSSGSNTTTTSVASLVLSAPSTVTFGHPITVSAVLKDASGNLVNGSIVTFTASDSSLITFTPTAATALTDSTGTASIIASAASTFAAGATYISAAASITDSSGNTTNVTAVPLGISVGAVDLTLGYIALGSNTISAYGTTSVSIPVYIDGANATVPISVSFTSACVISGKAAMTSPVNNNTSTGIASTTYKDNGCSGADTIIASLSNGSSSSALLTVATPAISNIQFVSATPAIIGTSTASAASLPKNSLVKFKIVDINNNGKEGVLVDFSLIPANAPGGITFTPASATSDADGYVTTSVSSGTVPTPVWIVATVHGSSPAILSQSNTLTITTGLPTENFFSLSISTPNIEGYRYDGTQATVTIIASDRLADPVPDGTVINFIAEGGHFNNSGTSTATCNTIGGTCSVTFLSADYRPVGETIVNSSDVTVGAVAALDGSGSPITITYNNGTNSGPLYVQNNRTTILAYALGEESFVDANGNNSYDEGETFYDLGDLFLDSNENGIWDSNPTQPNLAEQYIAYPAAVGTSACQTHYWSGGTEYTTDLPSGYGDVPSKQNTCDGAWGQNYVRRDGVIIMSDSFAQVSQANFTVYQNCFGTYTFWLMDGYYNPMPSGTTVAVDSNYTSINYTYYGTTGITATPAAVNVAGTPVLNSTHAGGTPVTVIVSGGSGCYAAETAGTLIDYPRGPMAIDVTTPKGNLTTIPINITSPTLTLTASSYSVATTGTSTLTANFKDIYGNAVSDGTVVNFTISTNHSGAHLSSATATTTGGHASVTYTAGTTSGVSDTIQASASYGGYNASRSISIAVTP